MIVVLDNLYRQGSQWLSNNVPLTLKLIRQDWQVNTVQQVDADTIIIFFPLITDQSAWSADFPIGGKFWLKSGTLSFQGIITGRDVSNTPYILAAIPQGFTGTTGGYINSFERKNWHMVLRSVTRGVKVLDKRYSAAPDGTIDIDLRAHYQDFTNLEDPFDSLIPTNNVPDQNICNVALLSRSERYEGFTGSFIFTFITHYFVDNALQIGQPFDGNLVEYVAFDDTRKFLNPSSELPFFEGYPFDLSFILPVEYQNVPVVVRQRNIRLNGNEFTTNRLLQTGNAQAGFVNRLRLEQNNDPDVKIIEVALFTLTQAEQNKNTYANDYSNDYTTSVKVPGTLEKQITEWKRIEVQGCATSPVFIKWRNVLGGMSYYVFSYRQAVDLEVDSFDTFAPNVQSISESAARIKTLTKNGRDVLTVGGVWKDVWADGFKDLFTSPYVVVDGVEMQVEPGSYRVLDTRENKVSFEFQLRYPDKYNQRR
jgi:hypothetical protein